MDLAMLSLPEISKLLSEFGGWGLSAVLLAIVWRLVSYIAKLHAEMRKESVETTKILERFGAEVKVFRKSLEKLTDKVDQL